MGGAGDSGGVAFTIQAGTIGRPAGIFQSILDVNDVSFFVKATNINLYLGLLGQPQEGLVALPFL